MPSELEDWHMANSDDRIISLEACGSRVAIKNKHNLLQGDRVIRGSCGPGRLSGVQHGMSCLSSTVTST